MYNMAWGMIIMANYYTTHNNLVYNMTYKTNQGSHKMGKNFILNDFIKHSPKGMKCFRYAYSQNWKSF